MSSGPALAEFLNGRVVILNGDITTQEVDAIVNAANWTLLGGGGVDGAIHDAGGPSILAACKEIRRTQYPQGLPTGEAVITTGGNLPAKFVIHTVGPIYAKDTDPAKSLTRCYQNCLLLATENNLSTITFPSISTGAFGYPRQEAAAVSSRAIADFLAQDESILQVRLIFFQQFDSRVFLQSQDFE